MTLSGLHSQMALIDLRIMISQDQLTYLTEKQYSIMDVSSNLDSMIFGAEQNPDAEFGVDMGGMADPDHATAMAAPAFTGTVTMTGGATGGGGAWHTRIRQPNGTFTDTVVPAANIRRDARTGEFYTQTGDDVSTRQRVWQTITRNGRTYRVSGRHIWMSKQDAVTHLRNSRNNVKKEEYKDQQAVKKIQTQLEMLMKQKDQVLGWLKKRLEDWFKGVGDRQ